MPNMSTSPKPRLAHTSSGHHPTTVRRNRSRQVPGPLKCPIREIPKVLLASLQGNRRCSCLGVQDIQTLHPGRYCIKARQPGRQGIQTRQPGGQGRQGRHSIQVRHPSRPRKQGPMAVWPGIRAGQGIQARLAQLSKRLNYASLPSSSSSSTSPMSASSDSANGAGTPRCARRAAMMSSLRPPVRTPNTFACSLSCGIVKRWTWIRVRAHPTGHGQAGQRSGSAMRGVRAASTSYAVLLEQAHQQLGPFRVVSGLFALFRSGHRLWARSHRGGRRGKGHKAGQRPTKAAH